MVKLFINFNCMLMNDEKWQKLEVPCDPNFVTVIALFYFKTGKL